MEKGSLTDIYVCPKCGMPHSVEEFKESRFCRSCGKFLSNRDRAPMTSLKKVPPPSEAYSRGLFPYSPYLEQLEFMKDVERVLGGGGVLVAEACNGFGKTVCSLSSVLPFGRKVVYATRTHEQVRQVLHEVERINMKAGADFSAVNLASRQHLCLNEKCRGLTSVEALEVCGALKREGKCSFKSDFSFPSFSIPSVLSVPKLLKLGRMSGLCPYFLARNVAENCAVVVAPYQYIFNEAIRTRVRLEISGKILIFDEAHNADRIGQEALSDTLSDRSLNNARRELELVGVSPQPIDNLAGYLDENVSREAVAKPGSELRRDIEHVLDEDIPSFVDSMSGVIEEIRRLKMERDEVPVCHLNGVLSFLSLVASGSDESYVAIYRRSAYGYGLIEYRCLDPSLAIKPVIEEAYAALIMSGTLSPLSLFTDIIGLTDAETRSYSAIAQPENVQTFIDTSVTTRFKERSHQMILRYGERIRWLMSQVPNGVLVFFPQRNLMMEAEKIWRGAGIIAEKDGRSFLNEKMLFIEGERASENAAIVDEYKRAAKKEPGAILFGVFRGRNAEGSNFPYEEARGIFLVGVPYADYRDPVVRAQIEHFNSKAPKLGQRWYIMDALRAANQAMGRGIRHRDDWCNFFLMDRRYKTQKSFISKWATQNGIKEIPNTFSKNAGS